MDERHLEIKVGALLALALLGFLGLLWLMGEWNVFPNAALSVDFAHTGNVAKGAPVKMGGVPVGKVEKIVLFPERRDPRGEPLLVRLELSLEARALAALHEDAAITITTQGPLGEAYVELLPGSLATARVSNGAVLRGVEPLRLEVVAQRLAGVLDQVGRTLEENPRALSDLVTNVARLSRTVDGVLTENRDELHVLAIELSSAARELRGLAATAHKSLSPGGKGAALLDDAAETAHLIKRDLPRLSENAGKALGGLAAVSGGLTSEDGARVKEALARYSSAGQHLEAVALRAERLLARIEAGEGTLGGLQKDPRVYEDLRDLVSDLKKHPWKVLWKE